MQQHPSAGRTSEQPGPAGQTPAHPAQVCAAPVCPAPVRGIRGCLIFDEGRFVPREVPVHGPSFAAPVPLTQAEAQRLAEAPTGVHTDSPANASSGSHASDGSGVPAEDCCLANDGYLEAPGAYVIPGLIDIHFHGSRGADLCDATPEALHTIAAYEAGIGVTAICPATMTLGADALERIMANAAGFSPATHEASLVGINMEGPYISPDKVGAQNPRHVRAALIDEFDRLQRASGGLIRLVDVAPEMPGNLDLVEHVAAGGSAGSFDGKQLPVRASIAHTTAGYDCAVEAFERGARQMTHLFNAMPGLGHRQPGPIAAAAEHPEVFAELIADGVHVHPAMVRLAFKLFGAGRICLISDSLRACGLGDGSYDLGGQEVHVCGCEARISNGSLAGSVSSLLDCLRSCVQLMEIPLEDAVRAATTNPARAIGVDSRYGAIREGASADAVVLNQDLSVRHVILRGQLIR